MVLPRFPRHGMTSSCYYITMLHVPMSIFYSILQSIAPSCVPQYQVRRNRVFFPREPHLIIDGCHKTVDLFSRSRDRVYDGANHTVSTPYHKVSFPSGVESQGVRICRKVDIDDIQAIANAISRVGNTQFTRSKDACVADPQLGVWL